MDVLFRKFIVNEVRETAMRSRIQGQQLVIYAALLFEDFSPPFPGHTPHFWSRGPVPLRFRTMFVTEKGAKGPEFRQTTPCCYRKGRIG